MTSICSVFVSVSGSSIWSAVEMLSMLCAVSLVMVTVSLVSGMDMSTWS